jgi:hypothetical protein
MAAPIKLRWNDVDAVYRALPGLLAEADAEAERQGAMYDVNFLLALQEGFTTDDLVQQAIAGARQGDQRQLRALLSPDLYWNKGDQPLRNRIPDEGWRLLSEPPVKPKRRPGRRKQTEHQRRAKNPVHDAADRVAAIEGVLQDLFPEQPRKDVFDRACAFAERLAGMDNPASAGTKVKNYLNSSRTDRRRI